MFSKKLFVFISAIQTFSSLCPPKRLIPHLDPQEVISSQGSPSFSPNNLFVLAGDDAASPTSMVRRRTNGAITELQAIIDPNTPIVSLNNIGKIINSPIFDLCFFKVLKAIIQSPLLEGFGINPRCLDIPLIIDSIKNRALRLVDCQSDRSPVHVCQECFPHHLIKMVIELVIVPCLKDLPEGDTFGSNRESLFLAKLESLTFNFNLDELQLFCRDIKTIFVAASPMRGSPAPLTSTPSPQLGSPIIP